jgi:hypothetical protein
MVSKMVFPKAFPAIYLKLGPKRKKIYSVELAEHGSVGGQAGGDGQEENNSDDSASH